MDKNRTRGLGKQVKGAVNEAIGRATGDASTELKGKGQKIGGKLQKAFGSVKDEVRAAKQQSRENQAGR